MLNTVERGCDVHFGPIWVPDAGRQSPPDCPCLGIDETSSSSVAASAAPTKPHDLDSFRCHGILPLTRESPVARRRQPTSSTSVQCSYMIDGTHQCGNPTKDPTGLCRHHRNASSPVAGGSPGATLQEGRAAFADYIKAQATAVELAEDEGHRLQDSERDNYLLDLVATRDLPEFGVEKGDWGGLIEPGCVVSSDSWVDESSRVFGESQILNGSLVATGSEVRSHSIVTNGSTLEGDSTLTGRSVLDGSHAVAGCEIGSRSAVIGSTLRDGCQVSASSNISESAISGHCRVDASSVTASRLSDSSRILGGSIVDGSQLDDCEVRDRSSVHNCEMAGKARVIEGSTASGRSRIRQHATLAGGSELRNGSELDGSAMIGNGTVLDNTRVLGRVKLQHGDELKDLVVNAHEDGGYYISGQR